MTPDRLTALLESGTSYKYTKGEIVYSLDFEEELYLVMSGYVKRFSMTPGKRRTIQVIYGNGFFFPLSPVFMKVYNMDISQDEATYFYEAVTDVEIKGIKSQKLLSALEEEPLLYADLLYEAGRRLKSNIHRFENNALTDDYQRIAHQLAYFTDEFGETKEINTKTGIKILVPLKPSDIADILNITEEQVEAGFAKLKKLGFISIDGEYVTVASLDLLKDVYL